jgi:hypothetical protein
LRVSQPLVDPCLSPYESKAEILPRRLSQKGEAAP